MFMSPLDLFDENVDMENMGNVWLLMSIIKRSESKSEFI